MMKINIKKIKKMKMKKLKKINDAIVADACLLCGQIEDCNYVLFVKTLRIKENNK